MRYWQCTGAMLAYAAVATGVVFLLAVRAMEGSLPVVLLGYVRRSIVEVGRLPFTERVP